MLRNNFQKVLLRIDCSCIDYSSTNWPLTRLQSEVPKGSSINDVTVLGGGGQGFFDDSTKALVTKRLTMGGEGVKNCQKLRDVIYGRPLTKFKSNVNDNHWREYKWFPEQDISPPV